MSGALNSVIGGGGGGLLSAIGGIVGGVFGGPLGAMIGQAVGNMLQGAVGDGVKDGVNQLQQEHGMPKFVGDLIKDRTDTAIGGVRNNGVPSDIQQHAQDQFGSAIADFKADFQADFVASVLSNRKAAGDKGDGAESWLVAIAKAMGKAMGDRAAKLVDLSKRISETKTGGSSTDQQQSAKEMQSLNAEFQATSQEFSLLQNAFSTAIKSIGEAMSSVARKQ